MEPIRLVLLAVFLLFAGCIGQEAAPAAQNQTAQNQTAPQETLPPAETAPEIPAVSGNITASFSATTPAEDNDPFPQENPSENETEENGTEFQNPLPQPAVPPEGLVFGNGSYVLALDDSSIIPASSEPCGIFSLWSSNGSLIEKVFICPGESEVWRSPDDSSYRIEVVQVAAPYSGIGAWAKVIVFG